jgi:threonine dehydrogenase-like Zn-dependent dehydrogenase
MRGIAAFVRETEPGFVDLPEPTAPARGQVLCRTLELGICGTDREILASGKPFPAAGDDFLVLGHECVGCVEQVGESVDTLRAGDLVVPLVRRPKPKAYRRRPDLLPLGQYVERGIVELHGFSLPVWCDEARYLLRIDPSFRPVAVFTEPQSVAEKAINEALNVQRARLGRAAWGKRPPRVLITGLGPIAFAAVIACVCRKWPITVWGRDDSQTFRAELVARFGGTYLPAERADLDALDPERDGFDLVLECTGSEEVVLKCAATMAACGIMVWLGSSRIPKAEPLNVARFIREGLVRNHIFIGSVNSALRDFEAAIAHLTELQQHKPELLDALVTSRVSADDALWHFAHRTSQGIKAVIEYS